MQSDLRTQLDEILREQHGLITRPQALALGASPSQIDRLVRSRQWLREERGLFRLAAAPRTELQQLMQAVLSVSESAVVSHQTAAKLWGLIDWGLTPVHVTVPRPRWRSRGYVIHRSTDLAPHHQTEHRGIPVTTPARTVTDLGSTTGRRLTERVLDAALRQRLLELDDVSELIGDVARQGRRGPALARELVAARRSWVQTTESELEDRFLRLLSRCHIRPPMSQVDLTDAAGAWIGRADFAYVEERLVIEVDGYGFHSDPGAFVRDRERQNRLLLAGFRVLRYTAADLKSRPQQVAAEIRRSLSLPVNRGVEKRRVH